MSPSRRDFFALLAGGAASLAVPTAPIAATPELTEYEQWLEARIALIDLREHYDSDHRSYRLAEIMLFQANMRIMELCPHDRASWHFEYVDSYDPTRAHFTCPACVASETVPHIDGRPAPWI